MVQNKNQVKKTVLQLLGSGPKAFSVKAFKSN